MGGAFPEPPTPAVTGTSFINLASSFPMLQKGLRVVSGQGAWSRPPSPQLHAEGPGPALGQLGPLLSPPSSLPPHPLGTSLGVSRCVSGCLSLLFSGSLRVSLIAAEGRQQDRLRQEVGGHESLPSCSPSERRRRREPLVVRASAPSPGTRGTRLALGPSPFGRGLPCCLPCSPQAEPRPTRPLPLVCPLVQLHTLPE